MSLRQPLFPNVSYSIWSVEKVDKLASVLLYCHLLCTFYRIFVCVVLFVCVLRMCVGLLYKHYSFQQFILYPPSPSFSLFAKLLFFLKFFHFIFLVILFITTLHIYVIVFFLFSLLCALFIWFPFNMCGQTFRPFEVHTYFVTHV